MSPPATGIENLRHGGVAAARLASPGPAPSSRLTALDRLGGRRIRRDLLALTVAGAGWLASLCLSGAVVAARAGDPAEVFPGDALVFLRTRGAEATADAIAATGIGRLSMDPRLVRIAAQLERLPELLAVAGLGEEPPADLVALDEILQTSAIGIGLIDVRLEDRVVEAALVVEAGERAAELHGIAAALLAESPLPALQPVQVGDHSFDRVRLQELDTPLLYGVVGEHFVAGLGASSVRCIIENLGPGVGSMATNADYAEGRAKVLAGATELASVHVRLPAIRALVLDVLALAGEPGPTNPAAFVRASGLDRLGSATAAVGAAGPTFRLGLHVPITGGLHPATSLSDADLALAPADALFFGSWDVDLAALFAWGRAIALAIDPAVEARLDQQVGGVGGIIGIEVPKLLAALGTRVVVFEESGMSGLLPAPVVAVQPPDITFVNELVERLAGLAGPLAQNQGVSIAIRSMTVGEQTVRFLDIGGAPVPVAPAWCQRDGRVLLALHPSVLEETLQRLTDERSATLLDAPEIVRLRAAFPGALSGLCFFDLPAIVDFLYPSLVPIAQAGISMGQSIGLELDASVIPSRRTIRSYLGPEIDISRRGEDGFLWVQESPLPGVGPGLVLGVAAGALLPATFVARSRAVEVEEQARVQQRRFQLRQVAMELQIYRMDHGEPAPSIAALFDDAGQSGEGRPRYADDLIARLALGPGAHREDPAPKSIVVYEKEADDAGTHFVLRGDGEVERLNAAQLGARLTAERPRTGGGN